MKLTLFDIDGTLMEFTEGHAEAFSVGFKEAYNIDASVNEINAFGLTDQLIILEVLRKHGLSEKEVMANIDKCMNAMERHFEEVIGSSIVKMLPGVPELFAALKEQGHIIGLVTGNLEPIAMAKMRKVGLQDYVLVGGYGSDHLSRTELVKLAMKKANVKPEDTFLFGDTPLDIKAAKEAGVTAVGVATGSHKKEDLAGADHILAGLDDTQKVLDILSGKD